MPTFLLHIFPVRWICYSKILSCYFFLWRTSYLSADPICVKFFRYNLKVFHHCHVYNYWFTNSIYIRCKILLCVWVTIDRLGLVSGLIEHLLIMTTSNYYGITNSHTLQFTTACTKSFLSVVFTSLCLVLASDDRHSAYSGFLNYPHASAANFQQQQLTTTEL
jgi:hypothetical protein